MLRFLWKMFVCYNFFSWGPPEWRPLGAVPPERIMVHICGIIIRLHGDPPIHEHIGCQPLGCLCGQQWFRVTIKVVTCLCSCRYFYTSPEGGAILHDASIVLEVEHDNDRDSDFVVASRPRPRRRSKLAFMEDDFRCQGELPF